MDKVSTPALLVLMKNIFSWLFYTICLLIYVVVGGVIVFFEKSLFWFVIYALLGFIVAMLGVISLLRYDKPKRIKKQDAPMIIYTYSSVKSEEKVRKSGLSLFWKVVIAILVILYAISVFHYVARGSYSTCRDINLADYPNGITLSSDVRCVLFSLNPGEASPMIYAPQSWNTSAHSENKQALCMMFPSGGSYCAGVDQTTKTPDQSEMGQKFWVQNLGDYNKVTVTTWQ